MSVNYSAGNSRFSTNQVLGEDYPNQFPPFGYARINNTELTATQLTQTLSFNKDIARDLHLNAFLGYEYMKFVNQGFGENGNGPDGIGFGNYGLDYTNYIQYSNATTRSISSYIDPDYELQSFFGRAILNYNDRYLLTATFRADGSSKFGANNKYGYFPSFALAWIISRENFFHVDWINSMKLRAGWGETGNQEFPPGSAQALYAFGNSGNIVQVNSPNPNLQWQSDRQWDIGLDFSLLNGRISGTFDYYYKTTTHLLFPSQPIQPAPTGSTVRWINLDGEIVNQGFEMAINGAVVRSRDFNWDLSVNASFLKNNVSGLSAPIVTGDVSGPVQIIQNGHPMDAFYTRKFLGLNKSTGFSDYEDNGNTSYFVGNPNPGTLLGFGSSFRYKKFFLVTNWYGSFGQDLYNATLMGPLNVTGIQGGNMALSVYQSPIKESLANPAQSPSSRYVQKGDYLRLSNLTLSYNIGNIRNSFKGFNVYVTAQNLILITSYSGFDPEVNKDKNINGVPSLGIDEARYPTAKTFLFGINFSL
jgi:iron complex outermembrane receptor protein